MKPNRIQRPSPYNSQFNSTTKFNSTVVCIIQLCYSLRPWKFAIYFLFRPFLKICHLSLLPFLMVDPTQLTLLHSHFIIKLIYKSRIHIPSTFSTHFLLYFLKLVPGQIGYELLGTEGVLAFSNQNSDLVIFSNSTLFSSSHQ